MDIAGNETFDIDDYISMLNELEENMSHVPYPGKSHTKMPFWEILLKISLYVISISLAIFGNSLVILIVFRNKSLQTTTNFYLVNLAVADLMIALSCSWVHLVNNVTDGWVLGTFFCKINSFAQGTDSA